MASTPDNLYVTYVDIDRDLLKVWGQRNRIGATYIERQLLQLLPQFNKTASPNPSRIHKGMFCFAKYTDDNYYRARVISRVVDDSVGVVFVDYGNKDIIKLSNIRIQEGNEGDVLAKMSEQAEEFYLAKVTAPPLGWTKEIISEIRRDVCYDEFRYQIIAQIADQKILELQFRDDNFSNHLVNRKLARSLSLQVQKQLILSYCRLVPDEVRQEEPLREASRVAFSSPAPPAAGLRVKPREPVSDLNMQLNFAKANNTVNYSVPPPQLSYPPPRNVKSSFLPMEQNIPKNSYYSPVNHVEQVSVDQVPAQQVNCNMHSIVNHQLSQFYPMADNTGPSVNSNGGNIIEILAQQVKQYIAQDNKKSETGEEKTPHHYVNSVLEVGSTYNATVSFIDDGPWSFSIQLMSSESELKKLSKELASCDLVPVKPPIILGHPCLSRRVLDGKLCRGVVVSISRTAVKVYFVDYGNTEDLPVSSIYELPPKLFKTEVLSQKFSLSGLKKVAYSDDIKKFFVEVVEGVNLLLRVVSLEDDNFPTCELFVNETNIKRILNEKMKELKGSALQELPKVGDTENVLVTWVVSPQKFFVQLNKRDSDLKALKKELSEAQNTCPQITVQELTVGLKCLCLYEFDGQWYRAVVTSVTSENDITVFYVDYGNTETVKISHLRKVPMTGSIIQLPNQAIHCCLKGFENQPYDQRLSQRFESLVLENEFQMLIESSENLLLYVSLLFNGNSVGSLLYQTQVQPQINEQETCKRSEENFWSSPEAAKHTVPNTERENNYQAEKPFERREKHIRGDQNRYQERENWRDKNQNIHEKDNHWTSDQQRNWSNRGPKEFGNWESSKPAANKPPFRGRERSSDSSEKSERSGGYNQGRNWNEKRGSGYGENRSRRFGDDRKPSDSEGKRFGSGKEWSSGGLDDSKKRFNVRSERSEEKISTRVPIKKEEIAPPGSKFTERVIDIGSCERGIVTYYFSPDEFFVQLLAEEDEFKKMMKDIQWYYSDKYSIRDPVQAGDIVIAQFSFDKILYRAEVIKPSPVTVRYVDYGNHEPVPPKGTWFVAKQFLELPQQVVKCRLSGLRPIGSDWPPPGSAVDKFFEFAEYKCTFLGKEGDMYEISMEAVENGKDVASEIIAAGLGRAMDPELEVPETDYSLLENQKLRLYISHVDSSSKFYVVVNPKASESIAEAIAAVSNDEKNLSPLLSLQPETPCLATADGTSWRRGTILKTDGATVVVRLSETGESVELSKDKVMRLPGFLESVQPQAVQCSLHGISDVQDEESFKKTVEHKNYLVHILSVTDDKRLSVILYDDDGQLLDFEKDCNVAQSIEPIGQLPIFTQRVLIVISQLDSPEEVYIQCASDEDNAMKFLERMTDFYTEGGEDFPEKDIPTGTLVAAKSKIYESWYRGRILSSSDGDLEVFYTDYGNREVLPRENVRKLDSSFFGQNALCRRLSLGITFDSKKVEEVKSKIWELCDEKELFGYFKNKSGEIMLEIKAGESSVNELLQLPADSSDVVEPSAVDSSSASEQPSDVSAFKVFVSHIDCPNRFWVHKETQMNELLQFQEKLNKTCEVLPAKKDVNEGDIVAAVYSGMWYRARVTRVEGSSAAVQFVDYGNTSEVDLNSEVVTELPPDLTDVPVFAMRCALRGTWGEGGTSKFEGIILQNEDPVKLVVLESGDPLVVDLFQNERSIAEMLEDCVESDRTDDWESCVVYLTHCNSPREFYIQRESCTAALSDLSERLLDAQSFDDPVSIEENELYAAKYPEDGVWYRARVTTKRGDEIVVHFVDYGNTSAVTEIKNLPSDLKNIPSMAEKCSLAYGENCDSWSSEACSLFADYADERALKMVVAASGAKRAIVKLYHKEKDITKELEAVCESEERVDVYVSHATSPTDFYIQYVDDEQYRVIAESLSREGDCEDLGERAEGTLCQARFSEDGCWYRAKILRDLGDEGCEVFFIDFGNTSFSNELKKLPKSLEDIPPRAVKCTLNLGSAVATDTVREDFVNLTAEGSAVFRCRVITPGETTVVSLKSGGIILEESLSLDADGEEEQKDFQSDVVEEKKGEDDQQREELRETETSAEDSSLGREEVFEETEPKENGIHNGFHHSFDDSLEAPDSSSELGRASDVSQEEKEETAQKNSKPPSKKLAFSERLVPGSISRGISLESVSEETTEATDLQLRKSKSPPHSPPLTRKDAGDSSAPARISNSSPSHSDQERTSRTSPSEEIVPEQ